MPAKLLACQRIKRSSFTSDEAFLEALERAGRFNEAEDYRARKGLSPSLGNGAAQH